jgi:5-enolpyruvylshikimate-3-phosphate synthase
MSLAVAGLAAAGPIEVHGAEMIDESFPGFRALLVSLGARLEES